jgi:CRISPR-associated protein Cpf1
MMKNNVLLQFTQQFSISKTLRFELKPIGETADYITDFKSSFLKDIVLQDKQRAVEYQATKRIIDDYHRDYIEHCLTTPADLETGELFINPEDMGNAFSYYEQYRQNHKDKVLAKNWESTQESLRKKLVKAFVNQKELFDQTLFKELLPNWLKDKGTFEANKDAIESFNKFTTYFTGFHENRKNMYSAEEQSTAISYRLMNENLPRFFSNYVLYKQIKSKYPELILTVDDELLQVLKVSHLDAVFTPGFFLRLLTQTNITAYNTLLGGLTQATGEKIKGLNEQINLYRQQKALKASELGLFTPLYKQILSDIETHSFIPEAFADDADLLNTLKKFNEEFARKAETLQAQALALKETDFSKTYIKNQSLSDLSHKLFANWSTINGALASYAEKTLYPNDKADGTASKKVQDSREAFLKQDVYNLQEINQALNQYIQTLDQSTLESKPATENPVLEYFTNQSTHCLALIQSQISEVAPVLASTELSKNKRLPSEDQPEGGAGFQQVQKIKALLDAYLDLAHVFKPLHLVKGRKVLDIPDIDQSFYTQFEESYRDFEQPVVELYNKARNYLSQKPFKTDKIKLNFASPTLLNGWDINKEEANKSILLKKNGQYYLAIMHPKHNKLFNDIEPTDNQSNTYEKVNYKLLSGANKMLPKVFFSKKGLENYPAPAEILSIYESGAFKKGESFNLASCHKLIDFFKEKIPKYRVDQHDKHGWAVFGFDFSPTQSYQDISDFYREVESQGYKLWFNQVSESYINQCVSEGKLFLFQIYNKDFSTHSKGSENLHTMYWKALFDEQNLKNVIAKLNGEAEIFFREHSIKAQDRIVHKAGEAIANKNHNNPKAHSQFEYEIVKDKRYTKDKFQFHVPITLNFKSANPTRFNDKINQALAQSDQVNVIGIDRGERHLLYYTVVNPQGHIIEQGSLNQIETDQQYNIDYHHKLDQKEKEREQARESWASVENIKELKAGYLSQVVHKLAQLIVKHHAIVCLEDLNTGFKRGRFKVEKQVYQKFEKALIDKLNYLVFKQNKAGEAGSVLNAYQLTAPFTSFRDLGTQTGILYYVRADYTSKIDPATGFIDFLKPNYISLSQSKTFFEALDYVHFDSANHYFKFGIDYQKIQPNREWGDYKTQWEICTHGNSRFYNKKTTNGNWQTEVVDVTAELKALFAQEAISFEMGQDIKQSIAQVKNTNFYKTLFWLLRTTLALRYSKTGTDEDYILSPVADENGVFFDSRKATEQQPKDADANGAYHIALKGLWNLEQIKQHDWSGEKPKSVNLRMKNETWMTFAQTKAYQQN